jgi:transposase InsO family protein
MVKGRRPLRLRHSWEARCRLVGLMLEGQTAQAAAAACGTSRSTAYRVFARYQAGGWEALRDRAPIARHCPHRLSAQAEAQIVALRHQTGWGPRSLSAALGRPASTIWRVLKRYDCSRAAVQPRPPANRYEYAAVGELVHLDIKKLGRIPKGGGWRAHGRAAVSGRQSKKKTKIGYAFVHSAVDACSRLAYSEVLADEQWITAAGFWRRAEAFFASLGIVVERVLTDNGSCYRAKDFNLALGGVVHSFTRPFRPQTNGKVERFNRTLLAEWAYVRTWTSDGQRARALASWLHIYNHHRHHTAVGGPPISRVGNLPGHYT